MSKSGPKGFIAKGMPRICQDELEKATSASSEYPLSVFNENSTLNVIPKLNFVNRLLLSKLLMSIKTDVCGPFPHCLSVPFQPMYSQYSQSGSVCVFCVSHRNSTTSLRVEILSQSSTWRRNAHNVVPGEEILTNVVPGEETLTM